MCEMLKIGTLFFTTAAPGKLPDVHIVPWDVHCAKSASGSVHLSAVEIISFLPTYESSSEDFF